MSKQYRFLFLLLLTFTSISVFAQQPVSDVTSISTTTMCAGGATPVLITFGGGTLPYNGNTYYVELSDSNGVFPYIDYTYGLAYSQAITPIGHLTTQASSGTIQTSIPANTPPGTGYRVRLVAYAQFSGTYATSYGQTYGTDLTVIAGPMVTVSPSPAAICAGTSLQLTASGATDYTWVASPNLSSTTGSVVTVAPAAYTTTYSVKGSDVTGCVMPYVLVPVLDNGQGVVFRETFGEVSVTTQVQNHTDWDNPQISFSNVGTVDVRLSQPSSVLPGGSGGANIFVQFLTSTSPEGYFEISGINTLGHDSLILSYLLAKQSSSSTGAELKVQVSSDGIAYTDIPTTLVPTGSGTAPAWYSVSTITSLPSAQNLRIRFRQTANLMQFRIDDVVLRNPTPAPNITIAGPASFCQGDTATLTAASGATYLWSTGTTTQSLAVNQPGTYSVAVTNTFGCTSTSSVVVGGNAPLPAPVASSNGPVCVGDVLQLSAGGSFSPSVTFSWTGPNGFSSTSQFPVISAATLADSGTYVVTALDTTGCSNSATTSVLVGQSNSSLLVNSTGPACPGDSLLLSVASALPGPFIWTGPNNFSLTADTLLFPDLQPTHYGTYTVTTTLGSCTYSGTIPVGAPQAPVATLASTACTGGTISLQASAVPGATGYSWTGPNAFASTDQNPTVTNAAAANAGVYTVYAQYATCLSDPAVVQVTLLPAPALLVSSNSPVLQGSTLFLSATGAAGAYSWSGPAGFAAVGHAPYRQQADSAHIGNYVVTLTAGGCVVTDTISVLINLQSLVSGTVFNDQNNNGVQDAGELPLQNKMVELMPGNYFANSNAQGEFSVYVPTGTYTLQPLGLAVYQQALPQQYPVQVTGTGQTLTGNNFGFHTQSVQDLVVTVSQQTPPRPGFNYNCKLTVSNVGNLPVTGQAKLVKDPILTHNSNTTPLAGISGDTLTWNFTNLAPGEQEFFWIYTQVPATATLLGSLVNLTGTAGPVATDAIPADNTVNFSATVVGSYDPNDKQVSPSGFITPTQVAAQQELTYKIRFQNSGTDTAFNILVVDTLSQLFDFSSFQMLSASHTYELTIRNPRVLEWKFNNILLPDSNTNEPASHGYIEYKIKPNPTLALGDMLENTAFIFFDFNEPILTNTIQTEVALPNGIADLEAAATPELYPNPNTGTFTLRLGQCPAGEVEVRILNTLGQHVYRQMSTSTGHAFEQNVEVHYIPAGIYLVQVQTGGKTYSTRLMLQK